MSAKVSIVLKGGNDALLSSEDFSDVLEGAAEDIRDQQLIEQVEEDHKSIHKKLKDFQGNTVGTLSITYED